MNYQCVWIIACISGLLMPRSQDQSFTCNAVGYLFLVTTIYFTLSGISDQLDHCYDQ